MIPEIRVGADPELVELLRWMFVIVFEMAANHGVRATLEPRATELYEKVFNELQE